MTTPTSCSSITTLPTLQSVNRALVTAAPRHTWSSFVGSCTAGRPSDTNHAASIIFGVFGITIALVGILLAWLQLRAFRRRRRDDEDVPAAEPTMRLVET